MAGAKSEKKMELRKFWGVKMKERHSKILFQVSGLLRMVTSVSRTRFFLVTPVVTVAAHMSDWPLAAGE